MYFLVHLCVFYRRRICRSIYSVCMHVRVLAASHVQACTCSYLQHHMCTHVHVLAASHVYACACTCSITCVRMCMYLQHHMCKDAASHVYSCACTCSITCVRMCISHVLAASHVQGYMYLQHHNVIAHSQISCFDIIINYRDHSINSVKGRHRERA